MCMRILPVHRHAIHMTLPVPEQEPHLSPPTLTGPVPAWLIRPWLLPSAAAHSPTLVHDTCPKHF